MQGTPERGEGIGHADRHPSAREDTPTGSADACGMIGRSAAMRNVYRRIELAGTSDANVVLVGETGTGKELAARAIHQNSSRRRRPFVAVNCAAIAEGLMESELFGHAAGAFTGANQSRGGLVEAANSGTLFLDEVEEIPLQLQDKLLRVLQEREVRRVGTTSVQTVDFRVIVATNLALDALLAAKRLRADFYYRIRVFEIHLPPLRHREDDVALLTSHMLRELSRRETVPSLTPEAAQRLAAYHWPGNVRELHNALQHAMIVREGDRIGAADLPEWLSLSRPAAELRNAGARTDDADHDKAAIVSALEAHGGVRVRAAEALGISRVTLWKKMREYGLAS